MAYKSPLHIRQMIIDPWSPVRGTPVLWAACDPLLHLRRGVYPFGTQDRWTLHGFEFSDPLGEGATYDDIDWVSVAGSICREGHFAFLGYYLEDILTGPPRAIMAVTFDNGANFQHFCLKDEYCKFRPAMVQDAMGCTGGKLASRTCNQPSESWGVPDSVATTCNSINGGTWPEPGMIAYGNFGRNIPIDSHIYYRGKGGWGDAPGSLCFSALFACGDPCAGPYFWIRAGTFDSKDWNTADQRVGAGPGWPPGGVEEFYIGYKVEFASPPAGTPFFVDAIWANVEAPPTYPYGIVIDTALGQYAYWTQWEGDASGGYRIYLWQYDFDEAYINADYEPERIVCPGAYGSLTDTDANGDSWDAPRYHLYPYHPYGFNSRELLVYGVLDNKPLLYKMNMFTQDEVPHATFVDLSPPGEPNEYVAHCSAATGDKDDLIAFINNHVTEDLRSFRSYSGGAGWFDPLSAPSGILRWSACHRHPSDGNRIIIASQAGVQETKDGGETWTDRNNPAFPSTPSGTSIMYKWW